jgi:uncharacterized membrane protein
MLPLFTSHPVAFTCVLAVIQAAGLLSACVVRRSEGSRYQVTFQCVFLGAMLGVGILTVATMTLGPGRWLAPGATLSAMAVVAMVDFGRRTAVSSSP